MFLSAISRFTSKRLNRPNLDEDLLCYILFRWGGNRVPAFAVWLGKIKPGSKTHDIVGGLDLMATFASVAGVTLPNKDREGQPIWQNSQERYDVFMTNWTEHTWTLVSISDAIDQLMKTYVKYPPANCKALRMPAQ
jgi:hypothetical protein